MMKGAPIRIKRIRDEREVGVGLEIEWAHGSIYQLRSDILRAHCPCASCGERRGNEMHSKPLGSPRSGRALLQVIDHTSAEAHDLKKVWNIGNYAIGILWGDGHDSGIYSYRVLQEICEVSGAADDENSNRT